MKLRFLAVFALAVAAFAANSRLYLTDGSYQMVREYKIEGDRVRYFSVERNAWEEIPLDLVDIKRSEKEVADREKARVAERAIEQEEEDAIRAERAEIARIPQNPGPYLIDGKLTPLQPAEIAITNSKTRSILKVLVPAPIVPGKSTIEAAGDKSKFVLANRTPEFYFRLEKEERLAIFQLKPKKDHRVVDEIDIIPESGEHISKRVVIPTFKKQLGPKLYRIWPEQPMEPGEYALVEYTEQDLNIQVWDFAIK